MDLAHKYAQAFLNVYGNQLSTDDVEHVHQAALFLDEQSRALFLLQVPVIAQSVKEKGLKSLCHRFMLTAPVYRLITLLLDHQRIQLLATILKAIVYEYQKRHDIKKIVIKSSIPLSESYRRDITQCIDQRISGVKHYLYEVDPSLIAGIRIQSDTILWEFSIDKRLRELALNSK